jgi:oligosaccharide repeat unit polymerase
MAFVLAGAAILLFVEPNSTAEPILLVALAGLCALPFFLGWRRREFDIFEPVYYVALVTFIYYVLVVIVHIAQDSFVMRGIDYREEVPLMLAYSILSLVSFYVGYYSFAVPGSPQPRSLLAQGERRFTHRAAIFLMSVFSALVVLWVVVGRFPLATLFIFGQASYGDWWELAQGPRIGYLYASREALPACLLLAYGTRSTKRIPIQYILVALAMLVLFAGDGGRSRVLLLAMGVWAYLHLERRIRPRAAQILIAMALVLYVIVGAIGFYRAPGHAVAETPYSTEDAWDVFIDSSSVAVATAAKLHWVSSMADYDWGRFVLKILMQWIPGYIWPEKYDLLPEPGYLRYFSTGAATTYWVGWYVNFGLLGIIAGMLILAWVVRWIYDRYRRNPSSLYLRVSVALLGPFLVKIVGRGDLSQTFYAVLFVFGPVIILRWVVGRYRRRRPAGNALSIGEGETLDLWDQTAGSA